MALSGTDCTAAIGRLSTMVHVHQLRTPLEGRRIGKCTFTRSPNAIVERQQRTLHDQRAPYGPRGSDCLVYTESPLEPGQNPPTY